MAGSDDRPDIDTQVMRKTFDLYAIGPDGKIGFDEFCVLLEELGDDVPREVAELDFAVIDKDGSGAVSFEEFRRWWLDEDDSSG